MSSVHARLDIRTADSRGLRGGMNAAGLTSLAIAGAALAWTVYRDIAQRRALARETGERKAAAARAEERRREEITVLKREATATEDRRENREARLVGLNTGASSGSIEGVDFPMSIQNDGDAPAEDVALWLTLDEPGIALEDALPLTQRHSFAVVPPGNPALQFNLRQTGPFYGARVERDGLIVAAWRDESGAHVDKIGRMTVFQ
jgi:hypothetical protein